MTSVAPKTGDTPSLPDEDEAEMTSIMSADQRKALQQAASNSKEADTLERDTAKPPPPVQAAADVEAIKIPKAPALPGAARAAKANPPAQAAAAKAPSRDAPSPASWTTWELVPFVLLAVAVAVALRM